MTVHIDDEQRIGELLAGYEVAGPEVYRAVASKSETAAETLHQARDVIRQFFGKETPVRLSVKPDPEIAGYAPVLVEIRTPREMEDTFERLQQFDAAWWLEASRKEATEIIILPMSQ